MPHLLLVNARLGEYVSSIFCAPVRGPVFPKSLYENRPGWTARKPSFLHLGGRLWGGGLEGRSVRLAEYGSGAMSFHGNFVK